MPVDQEVMPVKPTKKTRSKTGCRTCRIRKVKCDEEKLKVDGQGEPQCRRCSTARILCEWQGGPIPRRPSPRVPSPKDRGQGAAECVLAPSLRKRTSSPYPSATGPMLLPACGSPRGGPSVQAANSLTLSPFDRSCLDYLQDSALVVVLGKHWPWSTISYAYQKIAVREPMLMSMILASTASEINRSRLYDRSNNQSTSGAGKDLSDVDGRIHYGRALSGLREALKDDVKCPEKVEAILITLWLLIDYENRFGSGASAINIHIKGIQSLLYDHVVPSLRAESLSKPDGAPGQASRKALLAPASEYPESEDSLSGQERLTPTTPSKKLRSTAIPLFLLWTLYFFTPGYLFWGPETTRMDASLFQIFMNPEAGENGLTLDELYRISRQSPSRFWGDGYPVTAQLDDLDNLPGLTLYHRCHVVQFKITQLVKQGISDSSLLVESPLHKIVDQIITMADEYDLLLSSARASSSCDSAGNGRRVIETNFWASITFHATIVYFYLSIRDSIPSEQLTARMIPLDAAVSQVLELSLKLYRSRPHLILRIPWQLFIAGIATSDKIYQDWVSIRLRELGRYGRNFTNLSTRFDQIINGADPFAYDPRLLSAF